MIHPTNKKKLLLHEIIKATMIISKAECMKYQIDYLYVLPLPEFQKEAGLSTGQNKQLHH